MIDYICHQKTLESQNSFPYTYNNLIIKKQYISIHTIVKNSQVVVKAK
jgi:hypothetical protein